LKIEYYKEYSNCLGRDMEFKVFGHAGRLALAFAPQNGRFWDFENFRMDEAAAPWIEAGKLQIVNVDSIDAETWSDKEGDPRRRIELHERWFHYVVDELLPRALQINGDAAQLPLTCGCSMGAMHAANFFLRRPDKFCGVIAMSGMYNANFFIPGYMDDLVYNNSPVHYLRNMPQEHPYMNLYRQRDIILCCGQGAWEDDLLASTQEMDSIFREKDIPAWVDIWGYDVNHDWPWWQKQFPYFLRHILK